MELSLELEYRMVDLGGVQPRASGTGAMRMIELGREKIRLQKCAEPVLRA